MYLILYQTRRLVRDSKMHFSLVERKQRVNLLISQHDSILSFLLVLKIFNVS